jgi:hypothetical protein
MTESGDSAAHSETGDDPEPENLDGLLLEALRAIPVSRKRQVLRYLRYMAASGEWQRPEG